MPLRILLVVGLVALALGLGGAVLAFSGSDDDALDPAALAVAELPTVTDFSIRARGDRCTFDRDRGGMVYEGLRLGSRSNGVLRLSFYVQRDSLDDVLPGHVSTVVTFDEDTRSHTFDLVLPVSERDYEAGYDECAFTNVSG